MGLSPSTADAGLDAISRDDCGDVNQALARVDSSAYSIRTTLSGRIGHGTSAPSTSLSLSLADEWSGWSSDSGSDSGRNAEHARGRADSALSDWEELPSGPLNEYAFPSFKPLLAACQEYASQSNGRFLGSSFDDEEYDECEGVNTSRFGDLTGGRAAVAAVRCFSRRMKAGDPELEKEIQFAFHIVIAESVRSAMVAAFKELDLWPPLPTPAGVREEDTCFDDLSAPIRVIAQRAWNDEARRKWDAAIGGGGGVGYARQRAVTASFLVDFAYENGAVLPPPMAEPMALLSEFCARVRAWESEQNSADSSTNDSSALIAFVSSLVRSFTSGTYSTLVAITNVIGANTEPAAASGEDNNKSLTPDVTS
eukprot:TRINITY_DN25241_c0_g1_i1.p1 TRINITY_DN25241_c0_g1~~TRINITY_DN25241_c0_g1_i1.p1  ORF type:complete len:367 (-),score=67.74 TRINITY_DN25241_c0_g1_i1:227-1327(-)